MSVAWYWPDWHPDMDGCSDPPEESCSDGACPVHGWDYRDDDEDDEGEA